MHPMPRPTDRVVLIGMMGAGKSTVGRLLAERLGWRYADNDDDVRVLTQRDAPAVMASEGEASLHQAEAAAFLRALAVDEPSVVGAAAWVILDPDCADALARERHVIYLRARPETLHKRIGQGRGRRSDATDLAWLERRMSERDDLYKRLASITVDVDDLSASEVATIIQTAPPKQAR